MTGQQDRVICLGKVKYGEADLILKFISTGGEVYSAIAKSALKSRKRFGGGILEPTHHLKISVLRRQNSELGAVERMAVLQEAALVDDFAKLKTDYDRLEMALQFVKLVGQASREGDSHKEIFNLLGHTLRAAETSNSLNFLRLQFQLKFLHQQGMLPNVDRYLPFIRVSVRDHELLEVEMTKQLGDTGLLDWHDVATEAAERVHSYIT